ncbi:MAG TPA: hypothetical protein VF884_08310 [Nitrososphaeraceae archaeon]
MDNADLGEVQGVEQGFIVTRRGLVDKHTYYFPKILVNKFDGKTLFLKVTDKDLAEQENLTKFGL